MARRIGIVSIGTADELEERTRKREKTTKSGERRRSRRTRRGVVGTCCCNKCVPAAGIGCRVAQPFGNQPVPSIETKGGSEERRRPPLAHTRCPSEWVLDFRC